MAHAMKIPSTMRAIELVNFDGNLESLRVCEKPVPKPGAGEVLVRIEMAPVNPSDLMFLEDRYIIKKELPVVPGVLAAGTVVAGGNGWLPRLMRGRRVCCGAPESGDGTWAEFMTTSADLCVPLRRTVSSEQGCNLLANPATALGFMDMIRRGGHRGAIQTAAAGDVGRMLNHLCLLQQIPLINIVRREEQALLLKAEGAEHVLNSEAPEFDEALRERCEKLHATVAFDAVAGDAIGQLLRAMPADSEIFLYGRLSGLDVHFDGLEALVRDQQTLKGFSIYAWLLSKSMPARLYAMGQAQRLLGGFESRVRAIVSLEELAGDVAQCAAGATVGKTLIAPARQVRVAGSQ